MTSCLIHVDTASTSNIYLTQSAVKKINGNPFQTSITLENQHQRVKSIALKDAQIPIGFWNIRAPYNTFSINSIPYTLPQGDYTLDAPTFLAALNTAVGAGVGVFAISQTTNFFTFTSNSGTAILNVSPLSLLAFLGFANTQTGTFITATSSYIINFDTYIIIWIENLGQFSADSGQVTYKIPVDVSRGSILHYSELSHYRQDINLTDLGFRLDRLNITVLDRFGNILNNNGLDWSATFELEFGPVTEYKSLLGLPPPVPMTPGPNMMLVGALLLAGLLLILFVKNSRNE
jgi:hypothetical protein